jgi:outer membrane protein OmpA-like peptidoglycan-associated protein
MAKYTGGKFYKAKSKEELEKIFKEIYLSLRNFYLIKYKPPVFWGLHQFFLSLNFPKRDSNLIARGEYDTSELFDFDDLEKVFTRPILFEFNKFNVLPASYQILDEITDAMMSKPTIRLEIQGHTDNVGTAEINQTLSENRAKAVEEELIKRGIEPARLRFRGFGFSQPIESNLTEEGRAKNRRTAFKLISK